MCLQTTKKMKNSYFTLVISLLLLIIVFGKGLVVIEIVENNYENIEYVPQRPNLLQTQWQYFKQVYSKNYQSENEERHRFGIFASNVDFVEKHNKEFDMGLKSFNLKLNEFADLSDAEFVEMMNGYKNNRKNDYVPVIRELISKSGVPFLEPENVRIPAKVDWREKGYVTPVKDQGHCGSCWAFSATGALEGQHFRLNGTLISLSEQNLVDCSSVFGNHGCGGGIMDNAFDFIRFNHGIDTEQSYPYKGVDEPCHFDPRSIGADDAGHVDIPSGDEDKLKVAVGTVGPISVAIDASKKSFRFYNEGVYYEEECSSEQVDHGVLVVGYGTDSDSGLDYWIVKNSWGESWGEQGYIKMSRNRGNNCAIATVASYPLVNN